MDARIADLEKKLKWSEYYRENQAAQIDCYSKQNKHLEAACIRHKKRIAELERELTKITGLK